MSLSINIGRPFLNDKTLDEQARSILRKFGTDAHVYLPGANGVAVSGLPTNNYTLSDGSTGYSAVDGTAGRVLDAAGSVGSEIFDGNYSAFAIASGITINTTNLIFTAASTSVSAFRNIGLLQNRSYLIEYEISAYSSGDIRSIASSGVNGVTRSANGVYSEFVVPSTSTGNFGFQPATLSFTGNVAIRSIREVTGIHVTQATTANKPAVRRGLYNLLTYSNDLSNAQWGLQGTASKSGQTLLTPAAGDQVYNLSSSAIGTYTIGMILSGSGTCNIWAYNATQGSLSPTVVTLTATPTLYVNTFTQTVANSYAFFGRPVGQTATSITFGGAGLFQGTLTAAQILAEGGIPLTTSAAASNPSAGRYWLGSDSSDSLQLGSVPFQYADDWFICAGAACNNKAVYPGVFESLGGTARIYTYFDAGGIAVTQLRNDSGADTYIVGPAFGDGESVVLSSYKQSGQVCTGLNGTDGTPQSAPAGTFTLSSSKLLNGLDGKLAAGVIIKGQVSAADRLTIKRWVASQMPNGPQF